MFKILLYKSWNNTRNIVCSLGVKKEQQGLIVKGEQIKTYSIRYLELIKDKTK